MGKKIAASISPSTVCPMCFGHSNGHKTVMPKALAVGNCNVSDMSYHNNCAFLIPFTWINNQYIRTAKMQALMSSVMHAVM